MAITQGLVTVFKRYLLKGVHAFGPTFPRLTGTSDTFKLALYTSAANLDLTNTVYVTAGEVSSTGTNYPAGGLVLSQAPDPVIVGTTAVVDFADITFSGVTLTARGALIYNSTQSNISVGILDFGSDRSAVAGDFTIVFPVPDATNAIIRIV